MPFPRSTPQPWRMKLTACLLMAAACAPADEQEPPATVQRRQGVDIGSIDPARELFITDVSVVESPRYTTWNPATAQMAPEGGWSFGRLIDNLVPERLKDTPDRGRSRFVLSWLRTWEQEQLINGQRVPARPAIRSLVIDPWRAASGCTGPDETCELDFGKAPFRLLAIIYRPDLRRVPTAGDPGRAGEGRFVFGVLGPNGERKPFTVIFEYALPISGKSGILFWAERWHALGQYPFGPRYNSKLFKATREFTRRGASPHRVNGSALLQVRTNEVSLSAELPPLWEMREFVLGDSGFLTPAPVKQEPDTALNGTQVLGDWVGENAAAILEGTHVVPGAWRGRPFLAGAAPVPEGGAWQVPGAAKDVRRAFALATCSGCHKAETGTNFLHVRPREPGIASRVSAFLEQELAPGGPRVTDFQTLLNLDDVEQVEDGPSRDHGGH